MVSKFSSSATCSSPCPAGVSLVHALMASSPFSFRAVNIAAPASSPWRPLRAHLVNISPVTAASIFSGTKAERLRRPLLSSVRNLVLFPLRFRPDLVGRVALFDRRRNIHFQHGSRRLVCQSCSYFSATLVCRVLKSGDFRCLLVTGQLPNFRCEFLYSCLCFCRHFFKNNLRNA